MLVSFAAGSFCKRFVIELVHSALPAQEHTDDRADDRLKNLGDFYNTSGSIVRAYLFESGDEFRLTAEGLSGTPAVGNAVEADASYKLKAVASATGSSTQIGTIIAVEGDYFVVRVA